MNRFIIIAVSLVTVGLIAGCAKVPQQSVSEAQAALDSAKAVSADVYSKEQFDSAQASFDLATATIQEQEKKLSFMRDYSKVTELLTISKAAATNAVSSTEANKEKFRTEAVTAISETQNLIDSVNVMITSAQNNKMDVTAWTANVDSAKILMTSASDLLNTGDLVSARDKANAGKEKVTTVKKDIEVLVVPTK